MNPSRLAMCYLSSLSFSLRITSSFQDESWMSFLRYSSCRYCSILKAFSLYCHNLYTSFLCSIYFILLLFWASWSSLSSLANFSNILFRNSLYICYSCYFMILFRSRASCSAFCIYRFCRYFLSASYLAFFLASASASSKYSSLLKLSNSSCSFLRFYSSTLSFSNILFLATYFSSLACLTIYSLLSRSLM